MAMGRMVWGKGLKERPGHFSRGLVTCLCLLGASAGAQAVDVALAGLMPGKAMLSVDGGPPRIFSVGKTGDGGIKLLSVGSNSAVVEVGGQRRNLRVGQQVVSVGGGEQASVVLSADGNGHFMTTGMVNGTTVRFLVDTGATLVSMGRGDARRAGVDASQGTPAMIQTADGPVRAYRVNLNKVTVGGLTLTNVEGLVHDKDLPVVLLGMSFLNRMEMQRDGERMVLRRRY